MRKTLIALCVCVVLALILLVACADNTTSYDSSYYQGDPYCCVTQQDSPYYNSWHGSGYYWSTHTVQHTTTVTKTTKFVAPYAKPAKSTKSTRSYTPIRSTTIKTSRKH